MNPETLKHITVSLSSLCDDGRTLIEMQVRDALIEPVKLIDHLDHCGTCSAQWDAWMDEAKSALPSILSMLWSMK